MARIKIDKVNEYFNTELIGVFPDEVCILGGGYTEEEALKELKANAETWLEYEIEEAKVEQYCNGHYAGDIVGQKQGQKAEVGK